MSRLRPWRRIAAGALPLLAGWLTLGCQGPDEAAPAASEAAASVAFTGGTVLTLDPGRPEAQALAVAGDRILAVGTREEIEALRGAETVEIDLGDGALLPAFTDHHVHLLNVGLALLYADEPPPHWVGLDGLASIQAIEAAVAARAAGLPPGTWLLGQGWSQGAWGSGELPTHHTLTRAAPRHPVLLSRVDGHAGWANQRALDRAGISAATPDPPAGLIRRLADGSPAGVLLERAYEPLLRAVEPPGDDEVDRAFRLAAAALAAQGVTEVFDAGFLAPPGLVDLGLDLDRLVRLLAAADERQPLPLRVHLMVPAPSPLAEAVLAAPESYRRLSPRLGVSHLKLFADGALGSRGAHLGEAFADDPSTHGVERMGLEEIARLARRALDAGLDVATHAIGDAAIAAALDAYASILQERPGLEPERLRIEHFSFPRAEDQARAARLGIVLSVQPGFVGSDDRGVAMEDARLGPERAARVYAWRTLLARGARLAFGSDYFTAPPPPLATFYSAVTRRNFAGLPEEGWHPAERLARPEALELLTRHYPAGGREPHQRVLAPGRPADLAILTANPLTAPPEHLLDINVAATYRDGKPVSPTPSDQAP